MKETFYSWDMFRLSKSKAVVDLVPNTLRAYEKQGLRFYRVGKTVFVSKSELEVFIRAMADKPQGEAPAVETETDSDET